MQPCFRRNYPSRIHLSGITVKRICLLHTPTGLDRNNRSPAKVDFRSPDLAITLSTELRNINPISIAYAFQPRLRSRLTLPGRAVCRNPWAYGDRDSHPVYRYSYQQQLLSYLHKCLRSRFTGLDNAPLPRQMSVTFSIRSFGSTLQPRYVFGATFLDQ